MRAGAAAAASSSSAWFRRARGSRASDPRVLAVGRHRSGRPSAVRAAHGSVCRDAGLRRPERRAPGRVPRRRSASWTTRFIVFSSDNGGTDAGGPTGMFNNNRRYMGLRAAADRGASAPNARDLGGPRSVSLYPTGWGEVSNTPFPSFKTYTGAGGRRVSFIVSWPARIRDRGAIRRQFVHVTDVMPTLLELAGVAPLARATACRHGRCTARASRRCCSTRAAPSPRTEQYYECWSNRAYYRDGWLARSIQKRGEPIDLDNWTLHHLDERFLRERSTSARSIPSKLRGAGRGVRRGRMEVLRVSARQPRPAAQVRRRGRPSARRRRPPAASTCPACRRSTAPTSSR